jgi:Cellulase (glycosyl hydrolase family 5)
MPTRRSFIVCAGAAFAAQPVEPKHLGAAERPFTILQWAGGNTTKMRGLNCLQPFGYGIASNGSYIDEPYQNGGTDLQVMPDSRLRLIKSTGFDFIRMCIDPATLTTAVDKTRLAYLIGQLVTGIVRRLAAGLLVIVDLHVVGRAPVAGWSNRDIATGISGSRFRRYVAVAQELAAAIEALNAPQQVSIELFNEPPFDAEINGDSWPDVQAPYLWRAVRTAAPHSTLLIGGSNYNSIVGLTALHPYNFDHNTMYVFHGYVPTQLTLQGSIGIFRYIQALDFPPNPLDRAAAIVRVARSVEADESLPALQRRKIIAELTKQRKSYGIDTYFDQPQDTSYIKGQFKIVTDWADLKRVPRSCIINGESGCNGNYNDGSGKVAGATLATRASVIRALCQSVDEAEIGGYVVHEIQGSGFAVSNAESFEFMPEIIAAMGIGS